MKYFISYTLFIVNFYLLSIYSSCSSSSGSSGSQNITHIYKNEQANLHPKYVVFHRTNTTSELHFKINSKELLYSKLGGSETFSARISIHYKLISTYETKDIIDSATIYITDPFSSAPKDLIGKIEFGATFTNAYVLEVNLTDQNKNITSKTYISVEKQDHANRQNFILLAPGKSTPLFRNYVSSDERFHIRYRSISETKVYVRYYNREFPLPAPPYSITNPALFEYKADSLFTLQLNERDTAGLVFGKKGFYHVLVDTNTTDGITIYRFENDFPFVKKPEQLLPPLFHITSPQEYASLASNKNIKAAVDSFWTYAGGSTDRARELVKKYYNRVQDANNYFSSYLEGWKTDRGMIYMIYGPPNVVYKSSLSENWVYGEENNFNSLTFAFQRVRANPFTENDFRLERSPVFKTGWHNYVEMWRQGRIYSEK